MPRISIQPINIQTEAREGETLRDILLRRGIYVESPCNGNGTCGSCGVWIQEHTLVPYTPNENVTESDLEKGYRLSCQVTPEQDLTINLPMNFLRDAKRFRESQTILEGEIAPVSRLVSAVKVLDEQDYPEMLYDNFPDPQVLKVWEDEYEPKGLAIDLGTTTIVVTLVSLKTGIVLSTASRLNPQINYGHDIMTRIQHGSTQEGLQELAQAIRKGINELVHEVCVDSESKRKEILDIVLGGNTTMLQMIAEIDPAPLGQIPFSVDIQSGISYPVQQFGIKVNPDARVYIPPVLHAFIGSDITAGLLIHSDFFDDTKSVLFVDVGTNGEIALNHLGRRLACSAAAGPAFEGMGLSCGMRASFGAVESVKSDGKSITMSTVADSEPRGICGSGIVDLVSTLLRLQVIDPTGRFCSLPCSPVPEGVNSRLKKIEEQTVFEIGPKVYFSQRDVRQVQLAKGAIRAAIDVLMDEAGCSVEELDNIVIAGGFGFYLNPVNLETIGIIPRGTKDRVEFAGNACRSGCVWMLTDISYRRFLEINLQDIEHISIAQSPRFMELYAESMEFRDAESEITGKT
ncbi:ASKHA domain-containing protein [Desulfonatronospira sp.]|uniref:ASKHA domain-containing protein n=1 Tax=Desulfonatronospira sp. TaxID=1962951 RepID=UPI0025BB243B|nr:ASKHA domain-containing protein [Desulfonatronospira sp.]